jgi:surface antigen Omp85-like protein
VRTLGALKLFATVVLVAAAPLAAAAQAPTPSPQGTPIEGAAQTDTREAEQTAGAEGNGQPDQAKPQPSSPATTAPAQTAPASSRQAAIEREQAAKVATLRPYVPTKGERIFDRVDALLQGGVLKWHPFFESAYSGGGFTLGLGYQNYVSSYNLIDVRGSYTLSGYKRAEVEFIAPRMFKRRGQLSVLGGWREATQVGFYGIGQDTSKDDRTNYLFQQPYGSALLTIFPTRRAFMLRGGAEYSRWSQESGEGSFPSVETRYTPEDLPGLGAEVTYLHTQGTVGLDWRTSPGYTRRGGFIGATLHDYSDRDKNFGFQMVEYEAIQHLPLLRETWVLSFHGRVQTANEKDGQQTPFFMLPALGGGSSLRGYASWRFRDQNSLLLQAEWRIMINRYFDMAFFYDAGKVVARTSDIDFDGLKDDYGFGIRFHGPFATPLRVEVARSRESSLSFIFAASAAF